MLVDPPWQNPQCESRYYLPMHGHHADEPVTDVSNTNVLDSVEMVKVESLARVWEMKPGNKIMIENKFNQQASKQVGI